VSFYLHLKNARISLLPLYCINFIIRIYTLASRCDANTSAVLVCSVPKQRAMFLRQSGVGGSCIDSFLLKEEINRPHLFHDTLSHAQNPPGPTLMLTGKEPNPNDSEPLYEYLCHAPHTHTHTHIHTQIHTHTNTYIHTHIYTHTYTHTYIHTHTHTHTHTNSEENRKHQCIFASAAILCLPKENHFLFRETFDSN
jgi:hypothetical protein